MSKTITRPMLAATVHSHQLDTLQYPVYVSAKIDGIRCLIHPELGPVTRSFKPIPNEWIRNILRRECPLGLDGELVATDAEGGVLDFNDTQSKIMTRSGQPSFRYLVFDDFTDPDEPFSLRLSEAIRRVGAAERPWMQHVEHLLVMSASELLDISERFISCGYEGTMIRAPEGPYKSGRSTLKQGWLVKYKEWMDAEGTVIGFEELMHNANEDVRDAFGLAKRSSHIDNLVPMNTLGALVLDTPWGELRVGSGFDLALRDEIWRRNHCSMTSAERERCGYTQVDIGRVVTFKYQPHGMKEGGRPRFPIFKGFREPE